MVDREGGGVWLHVQEVQGPQYLELRFQQADRDNSKLCLLSFFPSIIYCTHYPFKEGCWITRGCGFAEARAHADPTQTRDGMLEAPEDPQGQRAQGDGGPESTVTDT